jgi:hypothetical protein
MTEQELSNLSVSEQLAWLVQASSYQQTSLNRMEQGIEALTAQIAYLTERMAETRYTIVDETRALRESTREQFEQAQAERRAASEAQRAAFEQAQAERRTALEAQQAAFERERQSRREEFDQTQKILQEQIRELVAMTRQQAEIVSRLIEQRN